MLFVDWVAMLATSWTCCWVCCCCCCWWWLLLEGVLDTTTGFFEYGCGWCALVGVVSLLLLFGMWTLLALPSVGEPGEILLASVFSDWSIFIGVRTAACTSQLTDSGGIVSSSADGLRCCCWWRWCLDFDLMVLEAWGAEFGR